MEYLHYQLKRRYRIFIEKYRPREEEEAPVDYTCISKPEATFLGRSLQDNPDQLSRFRQTIKIHKDPYKMRPIICCAGTFMNAWSKWLDYWLQKLKHHVPTYTKDSQQILDETKSIQLPSQYNYHPMHYSSLPTQTPCIIILTPIMQSKLLLGG